MGELSPEQISKGLVLVSILFALLTCAVTAYHFYLYLKNWTQPRTQTLIMRVMLIVPIWAILGAIIVVLPDLKYILAIPMDLYEGFAILTFMQLIYWYLGGKEQARWKAENKTSFRTCCYLWHVVPGEKFMKFVHVCIYQFAFTRPLWSVVACILYYQGLYHKGEMSAENLPTLLTTIALYVCLIVAMWALLQVYRVFRVVLAPYNTGSKFLAIKVYILLHAIQGFLFAQIESRASDETKERINLTQVQYCFMTIEMFIGALLNMFVFFHVREYVSNDRPMDEEDETIRLNPKSSAYGMLPESPDV